MAYFLLILLRRLNTIQSIYYFCLLLGPNRLNLPTVLSTVLQHSLNRSLIDIANNASAGPSTVVLIVSPSDRPSATETDRARELMASLRTTYFDIYFAYVAEDLSDFQNINNEYLDYSELFLQVSIIRLFIIIMKRQIYLFIGLFFFLPSITALWDT